MTAVNAITSATTVLGSSFMVPPPNTGLRITPSYNNATTGFAVSGATTPAGLDTLTQQAIFTASTGEMVFAGSRKTALPTRLGFSTSSTPASWVRMDMARPETEWMASKATTC